MEVASIILRTEDVDASAAFWNKKVGLTVENRFPGFAFLDGGPINIVLSAADSVTDESLTEVVFGVDDVRTVFAELTERGVPFETELRTINADEGRELLGSHFRDPDGHYGSLVGWVETG